MIYKDLHSPAIGKAARDKTVLLPIASIEQHGNHLPVGTDTELVTHIAEQAEKRLSDDVLLLPTLWIGSSHHHTDFAGTVSLSSETYIIVLCEILDSLIKSGFRRIVLLNGHGGNCVPASEALYRTNLKYNQKHPNLWIASATYWLLAGEELKRQTFMETPALTHACEYETSMMLHLRSDWVDMDAASGSRAQRKSSFYDPLGYEKSCVQVSETFAQMTENGAMGSPELATAEKGRQLYELIVPVVVRFLEEFRNWERPASSNK